MTSVRSTAEPALLALAASLAAPDARARAAASLAATFGADELIMFIRDDEVGAMLAVQGFPQTLPDGPRWRSFLNECVERGHCRGQLPLRASGELLTAVGYASGRDILFVLLGAAEPAADVEWLRALLPLFAAVFRAEQTAVASALQARMARDAATRSAMLAKALDRVRHQLEDALAGESRARAELEEANARLLDHSAQLESANVLLRDQAMEMDVQAMEMELQADQLHAANDALEQARTVAETASRAKTDFLATMSHELRTPLNAIAGHVQLIEMGVHGPVTPEQMASLERIDRSQRHLLGLINDILNLSRIEAGRVDYDITEVPLSDALADLAPMIEPQLAAKSLIYEVKLPEYAVVVCADREKLQQILLNLLSNAVKFTGAGGRVRVEASASPDAPDRAVVRVTDTGMGIPGNKLESIFEPFMQVNSRHSRLEQGTGLGLAISRDLARGMGGDLRAESDEGVGSTFTLTLGKAS